MQFETRVKLSSLIDFNCDIDVTDVGTSPTSKYVIVKFLEEMKRVTPSYEVLRINSSASRAFTGIAVYDCSSRVAVAVDSVSPERSYS
jgi:hypothetical protein